MKGLAWLDALVGPAALVDASLEAYRTNAAWRTLFGEQLPAGAALRDALGVGSLTTPHGEVALSPSPESDGGWLLQLRVAPEAAERSTASARATQERLQLVLEGSQDGFWDWDLEAGSFFTSSRAWELLGSEERHHTTDPDEVFHYVHREDWDELRDRAIAAMKGFSSFLQMEHRVVSRRGHVIWVSTRGKVVRRDADGRATRVAGTVTDVSERRQLEEQLVQSQKMDSIGRLAGGIAHDFNNLITGIMGYAELLRLKLPPGDERTFVDEIVRASGRASDLTSNLLEFARRRVVEPKLIDVTEVVQGTGPILQRLIGEDVTLAVRLDEELAPVRIDPSQLEQILINLAVNARDAMPSGGRFSLSSANVMLDREYVRQNPDAAEGPHVVLVATDTGCGMDDETKWRIFEPFFTTKPRGEGTGLGLSTCYGIVLQAGGHIRVFSQPNEGASFRIYLPAAEGTASAVARRSGPAPTVSGGRERILLVEDEELVRRVVERTLAEHGYDVVTAADGQQAVQLVRHDDEAIHLLLTDLVMPHMNGRELAETMMQLRPETSVLFMSGYVENVLTPEDSDALSVLAKPFSTAELLKRVRGTLDAASG